MADSLHFWLEETWNDELALRLRIRRCLHQSVSAFQRIEVYDSAALGRILCLGGSIVLTERDEPIYSEGLTHPALNLHPAPRRVLVLGGGDGGICREVLRHATVETVTVVEIDRAVVDVCREFLPAAAGSLADERVELVIDDAHRFCESNEAQWDIIIIDADELHDTGRDLVHKLAFTPALRQRLAGDGIVIAPLGLPGQHASRCRANRQDLADHFATVDVYAFTTTGIVGQQWAVAWCSDAPRPALPSAPTVDGSDCQFWEPKVHEALFQLPKPIRTILG